MQPMLGYINLPYARFSSRLTYGIYPIFVHVGRVYGRVFHGELPPLPAFSVEFPSKLAPHDDCPIFSIGLTGESCH
jgi:hypothetical protein